MAAEGPRSTWTDARLDDFEGEVSSIRSDMTAFRAEMNGRFDRIDGKFERIDGKFERIDGKFERIDSRIDELHRTLFVVSGGLAASILVSAAGIAATQI